jgi:hypothetical protein
MSHQATHKVSITTIRNRRTTVNFSERFQRTSRTLRLLPLPRFISPATTISLQRPASGTASAGCPESAWKDVLVSD